MDGHNKLAEMRKMESCITSCRKPQVAAAIP